MQMKVVDYTSSNAAQEFSSSLQEIGFSVLKNHPLSSTLIHQAYTEWFAFFSSDMQAKQAYLFDPKTHDGYVSPDLSETAKGYDIKDLKEFYHFYWGQRCPAELRSVTETLFQSMQQLAQKLLGWVQAEMPQDITDTLSMPLSDMVKDSKDTLLRFLHYPPLKGDEEPGAIRAAAHEDINLLTVLPSATTRGLQVKNRQGEWLDVPFGDGWLIVNSGDMLEECTQGFYKATTHRVINPEGEAGRKSRLSIPMFLHPRPEVVLSERHSAESYRLERFAELGLNG